MAGSSCFPRDLGCSSPSASRAKAPWQEWEGSLGSAMACTGAAWAVPGLSEEQCGQCWGSQEGSMGSAGALRKAAWAMGFLLQPWLPEFPAGRAAAWPLSRTVAPDVWELLGTWWM